VVVLLDTCAIIWMVEDAPLDKVARAAIRRAANSHLVLVSPVSAWEIGLIANRASAGFRFHPSPVLWFQTLLAKPGIYLTPLAPNAAIEAAALPGRLHRDPADRLLIATARDLGAPLVTRDTRILAYAAQGYLDVIPC
jgi:PIN domain nuclease of toxin-antitoxin system